MSGEDKHNNHVLPKLYLNGFAVAPNQPFIWVYRRGVAYDPGRQKYNHREIESKNPHLEPLSNAGAEMDFYADPNPDGTKDYQTIENKLELLEKPHNEILQKIRAHQELNRDEKHLFSTYIVLMQRRVAPMRKRLKTMVATKGVYEPTNQLYRNILKYLDWEDMPEVREAIRDFAQEKALHHDHVHFHNQLSTKSPESMIVEVLPKLAWSFWVATGPDLFLTSDDPVYVKYGLIRDRHLSELSFPICSDVAMVASPHPKAKEGFQRAEFSVSDR